MCCQKAFIIFIPLFFFFGCVPKIDKASPIQEGAVADDFSKSHNLFEYNDKELVREWWRGYSDEQLDEIMAKALSSAPTLASMQARYAQANSIIASVESRNLPHLSVNASVIRERFSQNHIFPPPLGGGTYTQYQPSLILDYDFDFWNARSSHILALKNEALAQKASIEASKIALSSAICKMYLSWNYDERKIHLLEDIAKNTNEELKIITRQHALGFIDALKVYTQKSASLEIMQQITQLKRSIEGKKESICVLGGFLPSFAQSMKKPNINDAFELPLPKEVMLNLLAHRPDVSVAKYRALSKSHTIEQAKAKFYPNISLSGIVGFTSFDWTKLIDDSSYTPSAGVALSLPLLDWGERNANLQNSLSDYNSLVYDYNQVVINAANEVVVLLKQSKLLQEQQHYHHEDISAKKANEIIEYKKLSLGLHNQLSYLSAQKTVFEGEIQALSLLEEKSLIQVNLIQALGGGYTHKEDSNASQ